MKREANINYSINFSLLMRWNIHSYAYFGNIDGFIVEIVQKIYAIICIVEK